jgi:predicted amidohydrolase YtcJ
MSVKNWLGTAAFVASMIAMATTTTRSQSIPDPCANARDLRLTNGKVMTMDGKDAIVKELTIQDGRFAFVGPVGNNKLAPCTRVVDLKGRTVIPGLIDNHNHFVLFGMRQGHEVQLENAVNIPEAMATLKGKAATLPAGAWVTTIGDWRTIQFHENRNPTLKEVDQAVPDHPVLLVPANGACVTNTLGKKFFESKDIPVSDDGVIAAGGPTWKALAELRKMWSLEDAIRGTDYAQNYLLAYGLTTSVDMGFFATPGSPDLQDDEATDSIASLDPWTGYDALIELNRRQQLNHRVRLFIISQDKNMDLPMLKQRLLNTFPEFGDDMLRISGIGEFATPWIGLGQGKRPDNYQAAMDMIAQHGWSFAQHDGTPADEQYLADVFAKANEIAPIANLHWRMEHVRSMDPQLITKVKELNVGLALHSGRYLSAGSNRQPAGAAGGANSAPSAPVGPYYRTLLASGARVGAGSDAGDFAVLNPWLNIYYIVTGKDVTGQLVNDGEQVSREQAVKLYSADNGWFFREEDKLGSIEPGKLGDLAVLSADFFDPKRVSDEDIKHIKSVLTVVGGKVVYDDIH